MAPTAERATMVEIIALKPFIFDLLLNLVIVDNRIILQPRKLKFFLPRRVVIQIRCELVDCATVKGG
jgi:hypothetical protein